MAVFEFIGGFSKTELYKCAEKQGVFGQLPPDEGSAQSLSTQPYSNIPHSDTRPVCEDLWTGKIHIDNLSWNMTDTTLKDILGAQYAKLSDNMEDIWKRRCRQYNLYNGDLLGTTQFSEGRFQCFTYTFKEHITMVQLGITLSGHTGNLGFKIHVFSENGNKVLIGRRSKSAEHMPYYLSSPGGMFELHDLKNPVASAVLRELQEETGITRSDIDWPTFQLIAIQREDANKIAIDMVLEARLKGPVKVKMNEEWEKLYWTDRTKPLPQGKVMKHLKFCTR